MNGRLTAFLIVVILWAGVAHGFEVASDEVCGYALQAQQAQEKDIQYGRGRPADVLHIVIDVAIDFEAETVSGATTTTLVPIGEALRQVSFDSVGLDVASVVLDDHTSCEYEVTEDKLNIFLPKPVEPGVEFSLTVLYSAKPQEGLYFRTPRMGYKGSEVMVWSQGEPDEARHWFPNFDFPNDKATTEVIATVPERFTALSNGRLVDTTRAGPRGTKTYHWRQEVPHSSYLVVLVAGDFETIDDSKYDVPIYYYVPKGRAKDARLSLGKTPEIIRFFEDKIGVKYPYAKYGQVTITDSFFGGMENTSLTTLIERTLHGQAAHLTYSSDGLNAHEAAHQWWGDLLTCRDWSHIWLNEGFANYFDALFVEHDRGVDEFYYEMLGTQRRYLEADTGDARAPVVRRRFDDPMELFDSRAYSKGGWILHMLRRKLGDDLFWKCMHEYCVRYAQKVVETNDLLRTLEDVSGHGLEPFFDQWVYHGGYPELEVTFKWNNTERRAKVTVKQTQTIDEITPIFQFEAKVRFNGEDFEREECFQITEQEHTFYTVLPGKPDYVRFDPDGDILKKLTFKKSKDMLLAQLEHDTSVLGRISAAQGLGEHNTDKVVEALGNCFRDDPFFGVRVEVAQVLADVDNKGAMDLLIHGLEQEDARVRLAVVQALGKTEDAAGKALLGMLDDPSPYVVASAIQSLADLDYTEAIGPITKALGRDSHNQVIRNAALDALAGLQAKDRLNTVIAYTAPGKPRMSRPAAIRAVARIGKWMDKQERPRKALLKLLDDPSRWIRVTTVSALGDLGDEDALDPLRRFEGAANSDREKESARKAIESIRSRRSQTGEVKVLRERVSELEKTLQKIEDGLDDLESRLEAKEDMDEEDEGAKDEKEKGEEAKDSERQD